MGKSVAVRVAVSALSRTRLVRKMTCHVSHEVVDVLSALLLEDVDSSWQAQLLLSQRSLLKPPSYEKIYGAMFRRPRQYPEPVFVVELAEHLERRVLFPLLSFGESNTVILQSFSQFFTIAMTIPAKELADHGGGRFIFVFSPSTKLHAIDAPSSSDLARAKFISVGDLTASQSIDFLLQTGCNKSQATEVHELIGGHLPFLLQKPVDLFCNGIISLGDLAKNFTALVRNAFLSVDTVLTCEGSTSCACKAMCAIRGKRWSYDGLKRAAPLLLQTNLMRSSLGLQSYVPEINSLFVQCYVQRVCTCNTTSSSSSKDSDSVIVPVCGNHF